MLGETAIQIIVRLRSGLDGMSFLSVIIRLCLSISLSLLAVVQHNSHQTYFQLEFSDVEMPENAEMMSNHHHVISKNSIFLDPPQHGEMRFL